MPMRPVCQNIGPRPSHTPPPPLIFPNNRPTSRAKKNPSISLIWAAEATQNIFGLMGKTRKRPTGSVVLENFTAVQS